MVCILTNDSLFFFPFNSMRYFDRAALFVEACLKYGALEVNDDTNILFLKSSLLSKIFTSDLVFWKAEQLHKLLYYV